MGLRVLQANIDNISMGGAYILIKKMETHMLDEGIAFDYLSIGTFDHDMQGPLGMTSENILYDLNLRKNRLIGHVLLPFKVYKVLMKNSYEIIHINSDSSWKALLYAFPARKAGVKKIFVHSHSIGVDGDYKILKTGCHLLLKKMLNKYTDVRLACSKEAEKWMFLNDETETHILFNGINLEEYRYDLNLRREIRDTLNIDDTFLIGHVGMVSEIKNQKFIIQIISELVKKGMSAKALLIGDCSDEWKQKLSTLADKFGIKDRIIFYGKTQKVAQLLNAIDVFVFPSLFEGASLALVEAQANGLPCIISEAVPKITTISEWAVRKDLSDGAKSWAEECIRIKDSNNEVRIHRVLELEYDIKLTSVNLAILYNKAKEE